jgi:hypothetical protein
MAAAGAQPSQLAGQPCLKLTRRVAAYAEPGEKGIRR